MKLPSWAMSETYWYKRCARLVDRANELIEGRLGVIESAGEFNKDRFWFRAEKDPDFLIFTLIDSDTDHLPVDSVRQHWGKDTLKQKDIEIQSAETFYRAQAIEAARNLIKKYNPDPKEISDPSS